MLYESISPMVKSYIRSHILKQDFLLLFNTKYCYISLYENAIILTWILADCYSASLKIGINSKLCTDASLYMNLHIFRELILLSFSGHIMAIVNCFTVPFIVLTLLAAVTFKVTFT